MDYDDARAVLYNNAGAAMMELGNHVVAYELFSAALDTELTNGRRAVEGRAVSLSSGNDPSGIQPHRTKDTSQSKPARIERAEIHLANFNAYVRQYQDPSSRPPRTLLRVESHNPASQPSALVVPMESRGYIPYIYTRPFMIPPNLKQPQVASCLIVCNLGFVYQCASRTTPKALTLYKLSAALLRSLDPTVPGLRRVRIALLNNQAVWCYENGYVECMRTLVEQLSVQLEKEASSSQGGNDIPLSPIVKLGIETNVQWLLTPLNGGSPAA